MIIKIGNIAAHSAAAALNFLKNASETGHLSLFASSRLHHEVVSGKRVGMTLSCERSEYFKEAIAGTTCVFFMKYEDFKNAYERAVFKNADVELYGIELDDGSLEPTILFDNVVHTLENSVYDAVVR